MRPIYSTWEPANLPQVAEIETPLSTDMAGGDLKYYSFMMSEYFNEDFENGKT